MTIRARPELDGNVLVIPIPDELTAELISTLDKTKRNDGWLDVEIRPIKRIRSTGPGSQNHHFNGHVMEIARETGNEFGTVKMAVKEEAVAQGYPYRIFRGRIVPYSETEASVEDCIILIDTAHRVAAELNIRLNEGEA